MTRDDLGKARSFVVIIRAIHERGPSQAEALAELANRGLWLYGNQRQQAGLPVLPTASVS